MLFIAYSDERYACSDLVENKEDKRLVGSKMSAGLLLANFLFI